MNEGLRIEVLEVGPIFSNCYIVGQPNSSAFIVDPGDEKSKIKKIIDKYKFNPLFIINTHGHIDHIKEDISFNIPVYIHKLDAHLLKNPQLNLSSFLSCPFTVGPEIDIRELEDRDYIEFIDKRLDVIHTPGHTQGSICIKFENYLFSGDTLFSKSIGRTDFAGSSSDQLIGSIKKKLFNLDPDTIILPGHGSRTTLREEMQENPFLCS